MKEVVAIVLVGAGGFIGSAARYAASGAVHRLAPGFPFPWGTLAVNLVGCFAIGLLAALGESRQLLTNESRLFLMAGVLGGFTTFSAFGHDTFALLGNGAAAHALANVAVQVVLGVAFVWAGYAIGR